MKFENTAGCLKCLRLPGLFLWLAAAVHSHCPEDPPRVEMKYPADGVSIQTSCYPVFEICFTDTFYRDTLRQRLVDEFQESRHVAFAYVDSVRNYRVFDTIRYQSEILYIDTLQEETVWIGVHAELKGVLPQRQFLFRERFVYVPEDPFATTYRGLLDTPIVLFFNTYGGFGRRPLFPPGGVHSER